MTTVFRDDFSSEVWTSTYKDFNDNTVDDTMMRVAKYVASAESEDKQKDWTKKFYDLLSDFKVTAGGRIYANAGTEYGGTTMMNCFSPDVKVVTKIGLKHISNVEIGDLVLTHKGRYRPVVNLLRRYYTGSVERIASAYLIDDIVTTPEHPFYQGGQQWMEAAQINAVVTPFIQDSCQPNGVLDIAEILKDIVAQGYIDVTDTEVITTKSFIGGQGAKGTKKGQPVSRFIQITENFAYLIGRFVGDGCTFKQQLRSHPAFSKDGFNVAFNATTETEQAGHMISLFEESFGIKPNLIVSQNNTMYVRKASLIVSTVLDRLLGGGFETKFVPTFIWNGALEMKLAFLRGLYDADGFITSSGFTQIEMTNPSLIEEIHALMTLVGMPSTRQHNRLFAGATSTVAFRKSLTKVYEDNRLHINSSKQPTTGPVHIKQEGHLVSVKHTQENYVGIVYNLSVEEDESYVVNNAVVHNCFVSPRPPSYVDSLPGILQDILNQTQTLKSEGGWGQNFSFIRPRGAFIKGIGVETPGAVKYMEIYDKTSDVITAGSGRKSANEKAKGKIRKGAMMAVMDVWHPDIIEFITAKQQPGRLTKFNMSVNCTDEFMTKVLKVIELQEQLKTASLPQRELTELQQLIEDTDKWILRYPDTNYDAYDNEWQGDIKTWEAKGYPTTIFRTVSVLWLWNLIMESTYNRAEPGVLFLDRANYFGPLNYLETISATNPCGEQTLAPGGVCNLGSINLTQFVSTDRIDLEGIRKYTRYLVRFLDNINSLSNAPLPEYVESMRKKRRIGVGILGWGSALFMLKVRFGSTEAATLRDTIMSTIAKEAYTTSIDLAVEKGMFELCDPNLHSQGPFVNSLELSATYMDKLRTTGIRNSSLLSIQPTGNTSIFANVVSGGLEPVFMHEYIRTVIVGEMPPELEGKCPKWFEGEWNETELFKFAKEGDEEILKCTFNGTVYKIDKNRGLTKEVTCQDYGVRHMKELGEWDPKADWAVTTSNLNVEDHVSDLKGFARWVDSAMSKTVNVPNNYSFEKFQNIYLDAYKSGYVKGVTTYRAGTMTTVLASKNEEEIIKEDVQLPASAPATMKTLKFEGKKWYLTVVYHENNHRPFALFVQTNDYEKNVVAEEAVEVLIGLARKKKIPKRHIDNVILKIEKDNNVNKTARLLSFLLRHGVLIKNIVGALDKVESAYVGTFVFAIKKFLSTYVKDGEPVEDAKCTNCGSTTIVFSEGCSKCLSCGSSKCG